MTPRTNRTTVVGVFHGYAEARHAVAELRRAGIPEDHIGLLSADRNQVPTKEHTGLANDPTGTRWEEGAGIGAAAGGLTGLGLGLAVVSGLLPPLGPVVAGGALVAVIASAGTGAGVGTAVGALCGLGIPEEEAHTYAEDLHSGRVVVTASVDKHQLDAARSVLHGHHAVRRPEPRPAPPAEEHPEDQLPIGGVGLPATPY